MVHKFCSLSYTTLSVPLCLYQTAILIGILYSLYLDKQILFGSVVPFIWQVWSSFLRKALQTVLATMSCFMRRKYLPNIFEKLVIIWLISLTRLWDSWHFFIVVWIFRDILISFVDRVMYLFLVFLFNECCLRGIQTPFGQILRLYPSPSF